MCVNFIFWMKMNTIRFRITVNWSNTVSVLFYGTKEKTTIINSRDGEKFDVNVSAFKLYEDLLSVHDDDFNTIELL